MEFTAEDFLREKVRETNYKQPTPKQVEGWMEEFVKPFKEKAEKWDKLDAKIGRFYEGEGRDSYIEENGNLCDIGEVTATAFGYL